MKKKNNIVELLKGEFDLTSIDTHEFSNMKVGPMHFSLDCYDANSLFNVSYLTGKAYFGLMKMTTIVITSTNKDIPIFSYDRIEAGKKDVCIFEIYDTCKERPSYPRLGEIRNEFIKYPRYEIKPAFSDDIKLKESFSVCSKGSNNFDPLLSEFFLEISKIIKSANDIDSIEKKELNKEYVDDLFKNGGIATNMFVKKIGIEETKELFNRYVFFTERYQKALFL